MSSKRPCPIPPPNPDELIQPDDRAPAEYLVLEYVAWMSAHETLKAAEQAGLAVRVEKPDAGLPSDLPTPLEVPQAPAKAAHSRPRPLGRLR